MSSVVPEGWSVSQLGNTLEKLIAGQSPNRKEFAARPGEFGILKTTAIDWGRYIPHQNQEILDDFVPNEGHEVEDGDILITKAGPVHRVGVVAYVDKTPPKMLVSGKMTLLRTDQNHDARFISYALSTEFSQKPLKENTTGMASSQTNFTHDTLKEVPLFVPNQLPEQQKIATILSSVDDVIEKTQAQIDKLKDLKAGMMQELLTKGIGHTEFKDSPVGRIPAGWDVVDLSAVAKVIDCKHATPKYFDEGYAVVKPGNIKEGNLDISGCSLTDKNGFDDLNENHKPQVGDTIYSRNQTYGIGAFVSKEMEFAIGQDVCVIHPQSCSQKYIYYTVNAPIVREQVELLAAGSTFKRINLGSIRKLLVPVPNMDEQFAIADALSSVDVKIELLQNKKCNNENIKKALMQDLLTGTVRVTVPSHPRDHGISASMYVKVD